MTKIWHRSMEEALRASDNPEALAQWLNANEQYKYLQETYNKQSSPLYSSIRPNMAEVNLPGHFLEVSNFGGNPAKIAALKARGIDLAPLQHAVMDQIANRNFVVKGDRLAGFSDRFLRELLPDETVDDLYRTGALARSIGYQMNPSGTSDVLQATRQIESAIKTGASGLGGALAGGALLAHPILGGLVGVATPEIVGRVVASPRLRLRAMRPQRGDFARLAKR